MNKTERLFLVLTKFAAERHTPTSGRSYFKGSSKDLVDLVRASWHSAKPGIGRSDLSQVVIISMPPAIAREMFQCNTVMVSDITDGRPLMARVTRRQEGEDSYIEVKAPLDISTVTCTNAYVVCYHHDTLTPEEREGVEASWYIVSIGASDVDNEPMSLTTMARNQLGLPGGTQVTYSSDEWARAAYYWSQRCQRAGIEMLQPDTELGHPPLFHNFYEHPDCQKQPGIQWEDDSESMCNDRCPACDAEIEPYKSTFPDEEK